MSLDIETKCAVEGCEKNDCKHALSPYHSDITVVGLYYKDKDNIPQQHTFRNLTELKRHLLLVPNPVYVGHNFKFDLHHLAVRGVDITHKDWYDTQVLASVCLDKIPEAWLKRYEVQRIELNRQLPVGVTHRRARGGSLKTLAPFFLDVPKFWEDPSNHDNDEYVLKDCEYTYNLFETLSRKVKNEDSWTFYERLMGYTKLLLNAELKGITLDLPHMNSLWNNATHNTGVYKRDLDNMWNAAYKAYHDMRCGDLKIAYMNKMDKAVSKLKTPTAKQIAKTKDRYEKLYEKSISKLNTDLNLDSPAQLNWLLKDYHGLDIATFSGEESTGKEVLERLAKAGREDVEIFLKYRKNRKLCTSFFPTYEEAQQDGILHCSFNPTGTRTGRLSSSNPNLQQVPPELHSIFKARPGFKLATYDENAIEPALMGYYSEDSRLCALNISETNFHDYITDLVFSLSCPLTEIKSNYPKERDFAKEFDLSMFYGAMHKRIQASAMKHGFNFTLNRCKDIYETFKEEFQEFYRWKEDFDSQLKGGAIIKNLFGRPFTLPPREVYMKGVNTLIQSSASDLVLESAKRIQDKLSPLGAQVLLLVHDEIVTEIPEDKVSQCVEIIEESMTNYSLTTKHGPIKLKVEGKVSNTWEK